MNLSPLFPTPLLVERPWGGTSLARWGRPVPAGSRIGESWEIGQIGDCDTPFDHPELTSLSQAASAMDGAFLGCAQGVFPLLVKLIDARETLSVQVHPACPGPGAFPKNECWVILEAPPGAFLYAGTSRGLSASELVSLLSAGDVGVLERIPVAPGDVVVIPAGTIHAITGGLVVAEIQQSSDTTYRVYDWGRAGLDGKPRELHLEQSASCLDPRPRKGLKPVPFPIAPGRELLCATPWFALERLRATASTTVPPRAGFQILLLLEGEGVLRWNGGSRCFGPGGCALLPSGLVATLEGGTWLRSFVPDYAADVLAPVLSAGGTPERALSLTAGTFAL